MARRGLRGVRCGLRPGCARPHAATCQRAAYRPRFDSGRQGHAGRLAGPRLRGGGRIGTRMHELSIAISIVEMAEEEAARRGDVHVDAIHLRLGLLSGVAREALLFSFDLACEGTALKGSRLVIEDLPVIVY